MRLILVLLTILTLSTCTKNSKQIEQVDKIEVIALNDSTVSIDNGFKRDTLTIDFGPNFAVDWRTAYEFEKSFNDFYMKFKGQVEKIEKRELIDVTGDGQSDLVTSTLTVYGDDCIIINLIISNNDTIWNDEMKIDKDYAIYKYGSAKLFDLLKPYSHPFLTYWRTDFISDYQYDSGIMFIEHYFLKTTEPKDTTYWKDEIKNYKGKFVNEMYGESGATSHIWDRRNKKLVKFYSE
jgi:hypothetical protein